MSPLDALSALSSVQSPANAGALNGGLNANPMGTAIPMGQTAPMGEGFGQIAQGALNAQSAQSAQGLQGTPLVQSSGGASPTTWGHMVQQMVMDVNNQQQNATAMVSDVLKGGPTPVHQAMIASEEASLSVEFLAQVRNKVVDAYNTVMQMQV